jgi:hypothetical protein
MTVLSQEAAYSLDKYKFIFNNIYVLQNSNCGLQNDTDDYRS